MRRAIRLQVLGVIPELKEALNQSEDPYPCRLEGRPPDAWVEPGTMQSAKIAREICRTEGCPIKEACLRQGMETKEDGIWGGEFLRDGKIVDRPQITRSNRSFTNFPIGNTAAPKKKSLPSLKDVDPWEVFGGRPLLDSLESHAH